MPIELEKICYSYPGSEQNALLDISLQINDGEFVGIMGHTGCGKSTLLQLMAGLLSLKSGRILLDGSDISAKGYDRRYLRSSLGMIFQYPEWQLFETTVEKDVAFGLKHSGLSSGGVRERVREALERMRFDYKAIRGQSPLTLSGGEKRRVAIAGVLAACPKILLLDEPFAGLDPLAREDFRAILQQLQREGTTIIAVSHNADLLAGCAERLMVLKAGRLLLDSPLREAFADAERMKQLGIEVSAPRRIAASLAAHGKSIHQDIVTYEDLLSALTGGVS